MPSPRVERQGNCMLVRAGFAAAAVVAALLGVRAVDVGQIYDEMYPVDTLKRGVFNICHDSDATFVRALHAHRESCYDRMPQPIALSIGWARRGTGLAAPPPNSAILEAAELFLAR